jgi:RNA polymerase sigma factor (sigma-70 family)
MSDTDLELLALYTRQQAEDAFTEIVRRHLDLVHSAALRQVRSPQLAEEVAQSTFINLARHAHRLTPDTILTAWLYEVTRREAIDVVRREARRQLREQIASEMNAMNATVADWTHIEPLLDEAMHALDETDRAAVLLRYFENKSLREVGTTLGTSENAAQKRLTRAVERLREFFAKRGVSIAESGLVVVISTNAVQAAPLGLIGTISAAAALVGTTVATTTATATKAIAMTTLQKTLITVTMVAALSTGIYEVRQASILRNRVEMLQQQQTEQSKQLTSERDDATRQLAALRDDNERLNRNTAELLKLRGEAKRFRETEQQTAQLKTVQSANGPVKARVAFGTELQDLGATTPERAASSLIWATTAGQRERVSELLELPKRVSEEDAPKHYEYFTKQLSNLFSGMEFTSVQGIKPNSDGTLRLNLAYRDFETGKTNPFPFMLRLGDSGWKVVVEGEPPDELPQK